MRAYPKTSVARRAATWSTRGGPPAEAELAVNLHKLITSNLPNRTEVSAIPQQYGAMFRTQFPIPPNAGIDTVLGRDFSHLFSLSRNRTGQVFVEPRIGSDLPIEEVVRIHLTHLKASMQPKSPPLPLNPPPAPSQQPSKLTAEEERTVQLILRGIHKILIMHPTIGDANSINDLRNALLEAFYDILGVPMVIPSSNRRVDPIELIRKNQGKVFTRLVEEPVTGKVSVKAITERPHFVPQVTLGFQTRSIQTTPNTILHELVQSLRSQLATNLNSLDRAIASGFDRKVADPKLWKEALEALISHEDQTTSILNNLIS
jgi:hypothetical protein